MNVVRPDVTLDQAREVAATLFGVSGQVTEVGSNQDRNFVVDGRYLLKVANAGYTDAELDAQDAALLHLRRVGRRVSSRVATWCRSPGPPSAAATWPGSATGCGRGC